MAAASRCPPWLLALSVSFLAAQSYAGNPGYRIAGSKHDFAGSVSHGAGNALFTYNDCSKCHRGGQPGRRNRCSACHVPHRAQRIAPLWGRPDPDAVGWVLWNGAAGQPLDGTQDPKYLTVTEFIGSRSALCLSCHDSGTAGRLPHDLSDSHPVGVVVPFGVPGWTPDVETGNETAGSNVSLDTRGSVGCLSCHSMHQGLAGDAKIRRRGEFCGTCHDR